jgi:hypothetical protein
MINPDAEIARLRNYLMNRNWLSHEADEICDLASRDINEIILDIISNAVAEATEHAEELGATEFIEDINVVEIGGGFIITTHSGKTDFSQPERQMLHDLTKNGEISEDGHKYKVIPVGTSKREISRPTSIFEQLQQSQREQAEARASLLENNMDNRSARAQHMASHFRSIISKRLNDIHGARSQRTSEKPEFRTASTKQDPAVSWVIPAKEMDMTGFLMDMNKRIEDTISDSIILIIDSYEKEFA